MVFPSELRVPRPGAVFGQRCGHRCGVPLCGRLTGGRRVCRVCSHRQHTEPFAFVSLGQRRRRIYRLTCPRPWVSGRGRRAGSLDNVPCTCAISCSARQELDPSVLPRGPVGLVPKGPTEPEASPSPSAPTGLQLPPTPGDFAPLISTSYRGLHPTRWADSPDRRRRGTLRPAPEPGARLPRL